MAGLVQTKHMEVVWDFGASAGLHTSPVQTTEHAGLCLLQKVQGDELLKEMVVRHDEVGCFPVEVMSVQEYSGGTLAAMINVSTTSGLEEQELEDTRCVYGFVVG